MAGSPNQNPEQVARDAIDAGVNEREIDRALRSSAALRQAISQKAFTGRLVPQVASDEPVAILLARLATQHPISSARKGRSRATATP